MRKHLTKLAGASLLLGGFATALTASSCTTPATEVVAGFTTQMQVPKDLRSVVVVITQGGRPIRCRVYRVTDGSVKLPGTIGIIPAEDRDGVPPEPVNISVLGFRTELDADFENQCFLSALPNAGDDEDPTQVLVVRRAALQYSEDRILFTRMPLKESCADVNCPEQETCVGGICEPAELDAATLPDYRDNLIFGDTNTCFDPEICVNRPALAVMTDKTNCTFRLPVPEDLEAQTPRNPGQLNVEVIYRSASTEILDLDDREGFVFPDPADPWTFQLAPNMCKSQFLDPIEAGKDPKILGVYASPLCAAKQPLQPICSDAMEQIQNGERGPASSLVTDGGGVCPYRSPLTATESLLYVLMDRSASMAEYYGPDGLQFAVGVPLDNPVAARTRMAFSFLPADNDACPSGASFETPGVGFDDPENIRNDIASLLGDAGTVLGNDPRLDMDAALLGAYSALDGIQPTASLTFNRKAVVVVGNRHFASSCLDGGMMNVNGELSVLANDARTNQDIFTYVAVLSAPMGADNHGAPDPQTAGSAIAQAGGTEVFDAVADETEGALAVQKVLNDLGSCLYDPLGPLPDNVMINDITLSFVNPITQQSTVISYDENCNAPNAALDAFGEDADGQIVICGQPCSTLRDTLTDTAAYFAALQSPAPAIPIQPTLPCERVASLNESLDLFP